MLVHRASAIETSGGFLHAGYLSSSNTVSFEYIDHSSVLADPGIAESPVRFNMFIPVNFNLLVLALVCVMLVLASLSLRDAPARRRTFTATACAIALAALCLPLLFELPGW